MTMSLPVQSSNADMVDHRGFELSTDTAFDSVDCVRVLSFGATISRASWSSRFAFSATGFPFLLVGLLKSNDMPRSDRVSLMLRLTSDRWLSTRQTDGRAAFGGLTCVKMSLKALSNVDARSFFTSVAQV